MAYLLLFAVSLWAGVQNALAGGGSFLTLPTLMFTGMDALAHCLEAYSSPFYHPMSQGIALEGMRLVFENLPLVYADPNNLDARAHMMSAAAMGATAFQKGLGAIHSLSHPIGAVYGKPAAEADHLSTLQAMLPPEA